MKMLPGICAFAIFALSLPCLAFGQDAAVYVVMGFRDKPLEKAVNQVALLGGVQVTVEKNLRKKRVTVDLDDTVEGALRKLAKAGGAHLVKTGPKVFEIRSGPARTRTGKGKAGSVVESEPKIPDWARPLKKKLEKTEIGRCFTGEKLPKVLKWLSEKTGIAIRLDPRVLKERSKTALEIHIASYDSNMHLVPLGFSALKTLNAVASYPGLDLQWVWRFGGIYVSTREHIKALAPSVLPSVGTASKAPDAKLRKKVESQKVTVDLHHAKLDAVLKKLAKKGAVKIRLDPALAREFAADRIDLHLKDALLEDALALVLLPRGLVVSLRKGELVVHRVAK